MKTEQVNIRLEAELLASIEQAAEDELLERGAMVRKLLLMGLRSYREDRAFADYQALRVSRGYAAQQLGIPIAEFMERAGARGISYPLDAEGFDRRMRAALEEPPAVAERASGHFTTHEAYSAEARTLPDRAPKPGGVVLVGLNPSLVSVRAGHYFQGRLGKRLWQRLRRAGLLPSGATPGREDDALVALGHGLTDVVKRATASADDLSADELRRGAGKLRERLSAWRPGLVVFVFKQAALAATGAADLAPGRGPELDGVPTFLLAGPYSPQGVVSDNLEQLRPLLTAEDADDEVWTQRISRADLEGGRIRVPRRAKAFFPPNRASVTVVVRGRRLEAPWDPRTAGEQERSATLRIGRAELSRLVKPDERLRVSRGADGLVRLD